MRSAFIYNFLIEANIMASIAILLMIPLRKFLRKQLGNSMLCFGWLLTAIRLLCPLSLANPVIHTIRSDFVWDAAIRPIAGQVKVRVSDAVGDLSAVFWRADNQPAAEAAGRLRDSLDNATASITLAKIWLLGVLLVAAWFLFSNIRFRLRLRADRIEPISGKLLEQFETLCRLRGIRPIPVYFTDPLPSACLVGVFRPYIALPLSASPQDAIHVLTHEICHVKNRDHLWGVLRLLCCAIHWFNPLVWLAAGMSRTDSELRCDDRVTQPMTHEERQSYASVLVLAAARRNAPGVGVLATGMTMTGKRLKTRVATVMQKRPPVRWLAASFAVLASLCLVCAFATSESDNPLEIVEGWEDNGNYLNSALTGTMDIRDQDKAIEYAQSIRKIIRAGETDGEYSAFREEDGSWSVMLSVGDTDLFSACFTETGIIDDVARNPEDERWLTDGEYVESTFMDAGDLADTEAWITEMMNALVPGLAELIQEPELIYVRDVGDAKYMLLNAWPKDSSYDAGVSIFVRMNADHSFDLLNLQVSGNG